jgi:hypothetical protein
VPSFPAASGRAAELCGMNRVDFLLLAGRTGVPVIDLDEAGPVCGADAAGWRSPAKV